MKVKIDNVEFDGEGVDSLYNNFYRYDLYKTKTHYVFYMVYKRKKKDSNDTGDERVLVFFSDPWELAIKLEEFLLDQDMISKIFQWVTKNGALPF